MKSVETIIVDDASSDSTSKVIEKWKGSPKPIHLFHKLQTGPAGARNTGMKKALNPYILFLDSDVLLPSKAIEWIRESLDLYSHRPEIKGVLGLYSETIPHSNFLSNYKNLYTRQIYMNTNLLSPYIHTPIFCIERKLLLTCDGFNTNLITGEDFQLGVTLGSQGYRFAIDLRINGIHLKKYNLPQILRENSRRIYSLSRLKLSPGEKKFALRAHRWSRILSLGIPGPTLVMGVLSIRQPVALFLCLSLLICFALVNLPFLKLCKRSNGKVFALKSAAFLFLEMLISEYLTLMSYLKKWLRVSKVLDL